MKKRWRIWWFQRGESFDGTRKDEHDGGSGGSGGERTSSTKKTNTVAERELQTASEKANMAADLEADGVATKEMTHIVTIEEIQSPP